MGCARSAGALLFSRDIHFPGDLALIHCLQAETARLVSPFMHGVIDDAVTLLHARALSAPLPSTSHGERSPAQRDCRLLARVAMLFGAYASHSFNSQGSTGVAETEDPGGNAVAFHILLRWVGVWLHLPGCLPAKKQDARSRVVARLAQALGRSFSACDALREVPALLPQAYVFSECACEGGAFTRIVTPHTGGVSAGLTKRSTVHCAWRKVFQCHVCIFSFLSCLWRALRWRCCAHL